ncbi:MAG: HU family DNA-binding protein [Bacteroides sp.]|nr:HU family DNA-binding protein [Bacteroides sp.]
MKNNGSNLQNSIEKNPINRDAKKYYPQLVTLEKSVSQVCIANQIKELSSFSKGDMQSVITHFLDVLRISLYSGHSVNLKKIGVFSLSAQMEGADTKEECTARNIKSIRINFRASKNIRLNVNACRADNKIDFIELEVYIRRMSGVYLPDRNNNKNNGGDDETGMLG